MKRIMPDTNVYELILKNIEMEDLRIALEKRRVIFYGVDIIRKELRSISKERKETVKNKLVKLRTTLISIYDLIVQNHQYTADSKTNNLADNYFVAYSVLGGRIPKDRIISDFKIVASASIHNIDILVSEDNKTMLLPESIRAYSSVNSIHNFRNPKFIGFEEFRKLIRGVSFD